MGVGGSQAIIRPALFPQDRAAVVAIFRDYAARLNTDICFQDFETELETLPGKYAQPNGTVLFAVEGDRILGCVAMRPITKLICEMKRLYVRAEARGGGLGRKLAVAISDDARSKGYLHLRLDTLPDMHAAQALYASMGFTPVAPYVYNPIAGSIYMELDLARKQKQTRQDHE